MIKRPDDYEVTQQRVERPKRRMPIAVLPTMFTLGNLVCGFFAIVVASRVDTPIKASQRVPVAMTAPATIDAPAIPAPATGATADELREQTDWFNCMLSGWLILLAMVFDALDGHVARLSRTTSDFGGQLDSLCDVVTFGVAPAFLLVKIVPDFALLHREAVWMIAAAFAACAALRLARFNVETTKTDDHLYFRGLPSPAAAAAIASFAIMFYSLRRNNAGLSYAPGLDTLLQSLLPFYALAVGLLMVSRVPYPHVVNQVFTGQRGFGHIVGLLFAVVMVMIVRGYSLPILTAAFVLYPPVRWFGHEWQRRRLTRRSMW